MLKRKVIKNFIQTTNLLFKKKQIDEENLKSNIKNKLKNIKNKYSFLNYAILEFLDKKKFKIKEIIELEKNLNNETEFVHILFKNIFSIHLNKEIIFSFNSLNNNISNVILVNSNFYFLLEKIISNFSVFEKLDMVTKQELIKGIDQIHPEKIKGYIGGVFDKLIYEIDGKFFNTLNSDLKKEAIFTLKYLFNKYSHLDEDFEIISICFYRKLLVNKQIIVDLLIDAIQKDYLLSYHLLNEIDMHDSFSNALKKIKLNKRDLIFKSLNKYRDLYNINVDENEIKKLISVLDESRNKGFLVLFELNKNNMFSCNHLNFLSFLMKESGSFRLSNLKVYISIINSKCIKIEKLQELIIDFLKINKQINSKRITKELLFDFLKEKENEFNLEKIINKYKDIKNQLILNPNFSFENIDIEMDVFINLIEEILDLERFNIECKILEKEIKNYEKNKSNNLFFAPKKYMIKKNRFDLKNKNHEKIKEIIFRIRFCILNEKNNDKNYFLNKLNILFFKEIEDYLNKNKDRINDEKNKDKEKIKNIYSFLSNNNLNDIEDCIIFSTYICSIKLPKNFLKIFKKYQNLFLIHFDLKNNLIQKFDFRFLNENDNFFDKTTLNRLNAFFNTIQKRLNLINLLEKKELLEKLSKLNLKEKESSKKIFNFLTDILKSKIPVQETTKYMINLLNEEVEYINLNYQKQNKKEGILFVPAKGFLEKYSSMMGKSCYFDENILRKKEIINIRVIRKKSKKNMYELSGNVLFIKTTVISKTNKEIPSLIIRADNPNLEEFDMRSYKEAIEDYARLFFKDFLKKQKYEGEFYILRPLDHRPKQRITDNNSLFFEIYMQIKNLETENLKKEIIFNSYSHKNSCVIVLEDNIENNK